MSIVNFNLPYELINLENVLDFAVFKVISFREV